MIKKLVSILTVISLLVLTTLPATAEVNYTEPVLMRVTVYTAPEGALTASQSEVREGIVAGKREWLGCACVIYDKDMRLIGFYEVKDTGSADWLNNGTAIDVYRSSLERCEEWIKTYGDYCYIQIIPAEG
jgi:hypothetical protein